MNHKPLCGNGEPDALLENEIRFDVLGADDVSP